MPRTSDFITYPSTVTSSSQIGRGCSALVEISFGLAGEPAGEVSLIGGAGGDMFLRKHYCFAALPFTGGKA